MSPRPDEIDALIQQRKDELREQKLAKGWRPNSPRPIDTHRIEVFLSELRRHGVVTEAARRASLHTESGCAGTFYDLRKRNPEFAAAWDGAIRESIESLELEAHRRAVEGWDEEVEIMELVADKMTTVRRTKTKRYSDRILLAKLQAKLAAYRPRTQIDVGGTVQVKHAGLDQLSAESRKYVRLILDQEAQKAAEIVDVEVVPAVDPTAGPEAAEDMGNHGLSPT